jgi:thioredoxin-dependent peroxiredoxin
MLVEGAKAPSFTLVDDGGNVVSLKDFRGKKIVLFIYPKDNTPGCTQESCDFRDNLARIQKKGAVVLGLSKDSVASKKKFKEKYGLNYPLLADVDRKVIEGMGLLKEKSMYGKKVMGIERTTLIIDEAGLIQKIFNKVKVPGHIDAVLAEL